MSSDSKAPSLYRELKAELERIQAKMAEVRDAERGQQIASIREVIADFDIQPAELFGGDVLRSIPRNIVKRGSRPPKFRHPETGETWSGQGATPHWFTNALAAGMKREDMLINPQQ